MGTVDEGAGEIAGSEGQAKYTCPECQEVFGQPEQLGAHLERHRAADTPPQTGNPCPKDCGRWFKFHERKELKAHVLVCDGSPPLHVEPARGVQHPRPPALPSIKPLEEDRPLDFTPKEIRRAAVRGRHETETGEVPKERDVASKLKCGQCGREFVHPKRLENHEADCGNKAVAAAPSARDGAAAKRFAQIREKRREIVRSDKVVDGAAGAIEGALLSLRAKRQALIDAIPELQDLNKAITALEAIAGPPPDPTPAE